MAKLPELHGLDSSLHRYPLALNTDGEPRFFLCSPLDHTKPAMALHTVSA